ncbi:MAG: carboxypeptidase regulatory-like domain-containing protein [Ignavibacteriae bacterium]|nr:carboxypeptidase regulatory-like domain-containing protein [Ignavibacteriota bacterium]
MCALFIFFGLSANAQEPAAPGNLYVRPGLFGGAVLHWDSSAGVDWYRVYKSVDNSDYHKIADLRKREFLDWAVYPHLDYSYYVTGVNEHGESGPSNIENFELEGLPNPDLHALIKGKVVDDSTNLPLREAVVSVFNTNGLWVGRTHTDTGGNYRTAVDTGRYLVRAETFGYIPEWFDNAREIQDAFVVELHQDSLHHDSTFTADFGLDRLPVPPLATVTGTVDSAGGRPLPNALVVFLRPYHFLRELEELTGFLGGFENEHFYVPELGLLRGVVWAGLTDVDGHYTASLLSGQRYIAAAFKPGYWPQFFNDKRTPFDADRIFLMQDTSGIDFHLANNPEGINNLAGSVTDTSGLGVQSHVVLLRKTALGLLPVRFQMTDSLGNYEFHYLLDGIYLVKAVPIFGYAPAWYSAAECGVRNWHNADTIHVGLHVLGQDNVVDKNICVVPAFVGGFARIAGQINEGTGSKTVKSSVPLAVAPIGGVTVYAISTTTSTVTGSDVTENDGTFSIGNLPAGSYTIVVDKEGYTPISSPTVTVDVSNNYTETNGLVTVTPDQVLSVGAESRGVPTAFRLEQNYPNPFNPTTTIRFALPVQSAVSMKIYNLIGQLVVVLTSDVVIEPGVHSIQWNGTNEHGTAVGSGLYFIKMLALPVNMQDASFTQVRKMVLVR